MSMYKNKILYYQLHTADPSPWRISSPGEHHHIRNRPLLTKPGSAFTSVQFAMPYLQKHETTSLSERFRHIPTHYFKGSQYLIT